MNFTGECVMAGIDVEVLIFSHTLVLLFELSILKILYTSVFKF